MGQDGQSDRRGQGPKGPGGEVVDRRVIDRRAVARRLAAASGESADNAGVPQTGSPGSVSGLERRRGPGRRLSDFTRSAEEGEMTQEQFLFLMAIDEFKKANGRTFPSWTDVLEVIRLLGYRKTMPSDLKLRSAEDWREPADTPANVRPKGWDQRAA